MASRTKVVAEGQTYEAREDLKALGFKWDATEKHWYKFVEDDEIDEIAEKVQDRCEGVEIRCDI